MKKPETYNVDRMRKLRYLMEFTLEDIANEMCTTRQTISNIEKGKSKNTMTLEFYYRVLSEKLNNLELKKRYEICEIFKILYGEYPDIH